MGMSFTSIASTGLAASQRHDLVGSQADVSGPAKNFNHQASSGAFTGRSLGFANSRVISSKFELHLGMRQKTELFTHALGNSDLALTGDVHGITSTGKGNTKWPLTANWRIHRSLRRPQIGHELNS
jgi:hypothetical protein